jgi:hypothetical protein
MIKTSPRLQRLGILMILVAVLLLVFATRLAVTDYRSFDSDEVRIITRAEGNFAQVIRWQPTDWPPLYNLVVSGWLHGISNNPVILRLVSIFFALFGVAAMYRVGNYLFNGFWGGLASAVALAAVAYHLELSIFLRGYIMALAFFLLTLWLAMRYFEHPNWQQAMVLALAVATMFYTTYISMFAFAIIGLVTVVRYGRNIWRWWLPMLMSLLLVLPELLYKYSRLNNRFSTTVAANIQQTKSLWIGIKDLSLDVLGSQFILWIVLLVIVAAVLLIRQRRTVAWVFLLIVLATPFLLYAVVQAKIIFHYHHRYVWWALAALALFIGAGVAHMPRALRFATVLVMIGMMLFNVRAYQTRQPFYDYESTFRWIAEQALVGDVLIRDTGFCSQACGHGRMEWNYYQAYYLDNRVQRVTEPADYRRIWYVRSSATQNEALESLIFDGRIPAQFWGPTYFKAQLFIAPPDPEGILFENGMRFHGVDFLDETGNMQPQLIEVNEQTELHLRLWWSVDEPLMQDYSASAQLLTDDGQLIEQSDGAPQPIHLQPVNQPPLPQTLTGWQPNTIYVEERSIDIPDLDDFYRSQLVIIVYDWRDNTRFLADGVDENGVLPIRDREIFVWGW